MMKLSCNAVFYPAPINETTVLGTIKSESVFCSFLLVNLDISTAYNLIYRKNWDYFIKENVLKIEFHYIKLVKHVPQRFFLQELRR